LAAAVVGHDHAGRARVGAAFGVVAAQHALHHDRQPSALGEPTDCVRRQVVRLGQVVVGPVTGGQVRQQLPGLDEVPHRLADVILAADHRSVDGQYDGPRTTLDRGVQHPQGDLAIPDDVDLQPPRHTGRAELGERRPRVAGQTDDRVRRADALRHRDLAVRIGHPMHGRRRDQHRYVDRCAEQRGPELDCRHVAEDARPEPVRRPGGDRLTGTDPAGRALPEVPVHGFGQLLGGRGFEGVDPSHALHRCTRNSHCPCQLIRYSGRMTQYGRRFQRPGRHDGADGVSRCCALS
jgi:hypothetical protein